MYARGLPVPAMPAACCIMPSLARRFWRHDSHSPVTPTIPPHAQRLGSGDGIGEKLGGTGVIRTAGVAPCSGPAPVGTGNAVCRRGRVVTAA
ncbi:MAG TPA: hypothetical protein VGE04_19965 [Chloroflexia bacterium]